MRNEQELRRLVAPAVQPFYPTPWRVAEQRGDKHVVVCAEGHYTCEAPTIEAAEIIAAAVNAWAAGNADEMTNKLIHLRELAGAMLESWRADEYNQDPHTEQAAIALGKALDTDSEV